MLFVGTSSTMAIDGKISKVCNDYRCLNGRDVKLQALGDIGSNLGTRISLNYVTLIKHINRSLLENILTA